jgi:hypothetical protein
VGRGLLSRLCFNNDAAMEHPQGYPFFRAEPVVRWPRVRRTARANAGTELLQRPRRFARRQRTDGPREPVRSTAQQVHSLQPSIFVGPNV